MGLISKIKNIFSKKMEVEIDEKNYLGVDINNLYNNVESAYSLCHKLTNSYREKEKVIKEYENVTRLYTGIQQIEDMNPKYLNEFENIACTYIGTVKDKEQYRDKLSAIGEEFEYLADYEEDISEVIEDIRKVEEKQRAVRNDINYIEGEKGELVYKQERLLGAQSIIRVLMIFLLSIFALSTLVLTIIYTTKNIDIFIPAVVMIVIIGFFGLWIYIFKRYIVYEIKKNTLLRQRAVELLNKIKLKYIHNEQFLIYEYKKYKVKSSEMLEYRWEQYKQNRKDRHKIHKISTNILTMEKDMERLFNKNNIQFTSDLFDHIEKYATKKMRNPYLKEVEQNRKTLKNQIEEYDKEINLISKMLIDIKENDTTDDKEVTKIVNKILND